MDERERMTDGLGLWVMAIRVIDDRTLALQMCNEYGDDIACKELRFFFFCFCFFNVPELSFMTHFSTGRENFYMRR